MNIYRTLLVLFLCLEGSLLSLSIKTFINSPNGYLTELIEQRRYRQAKAFSVIILSGKKKLGSGIIIKKQDNRYHLITNAHVLTAGDHPYSIQTEDQQIHLAEVIINPIQQDDLALLSFQKTSKNYKIATLNLVNSLTPNEEVYAVGFPLVIPPQETLKVSEFAFKKGEIRQVLEKPLEGGYQIGYTNKVYKGMSGGALINQKGEVIGINGRHAHPLWDAPEYYQDGELVPSAQKKTIIELSWGIPIKQLPDINLKAEE